MIPRCVDKRPVGENNTWKHINGKLQRDTSEIKGEENCMFIVGTGILARRVGKGRRGSGAGKKEESKKV